MCTLARLVRRTRLAAAASRRPPSPARWPTPAGCPGPGIPDFGASGAGAPGPRHSGDRMPRGRRHPSGCSRAPVAPNPVLPNPAPKAGRGPEPGRRTRHPGTQAAPGRRIAEPGPAVVPKSGAPEPEASRSGGSEARSATPALGLRVPSLPDPGPRVSVLRVPVFQVPMLLDPRLVVPVQPGPACRRPARREPDRRGPNRLNPARRDPASRRLAPWRGGPLESVPWGLASSGTVPAEAVPSDRRVARSQPTALRQSEP